MKILVCGGRDYSDYSELYEVLDTIHYNKPITHVVCGAQRTENDDCPAYGADWLAIEWAMDRQVNFSGLPAKWRKFGRSAGPRRNREMLAEHPDIKGVVAFSGGAGTQDMIDAARDKGLYIKDLRRDSQG